MIQLNIAEHSQPTGWLLRQLLEARGVRCTTQRNNSAEAVVNYGVYRYQDQRPALNLRIPASKLDELRHLSAAGLPVISHTNMDGQVPMEGYPWLARKLRHHSGLDIRVCLEPSHARCYLQNGWNYLTQFVPSTIEYRVWIYRRKHLGTYEKVLTRPHDWIRRGGKVGRNYRNGYAFNLVPSENIQREAVELASNAVNILGLDFGAVDIIRPNIGAGNQTHPLYYTHFLILEVNTAPGVQDEQRQVIQALADKIARWVELEYPRRRGSERE